MVESNPHNQYSVNAALPGSDRERDDRFYALLSGGAKTRLLEVFVELDMPRVIGDAGSMTASEICHYFAFQADRGWKFCRLLALCGLLDEQGGHEGEDEAHYALSHDAKRFFGSDGSQTYYFYELVRFWKMMAHWPTIDVLRGLPIPDAAQWPPRTPEAAEHLETWMRVTSEGAIRNIIGSNALRETKRLLDVGGGDGTIGCALAEHYPGLAVTVFNLPASAIIAERTIKTCGFEDRVNVYEGDFNRDEFPLGYDTILFSRVLTDWTPSVCREIFRNAYRALPSNGKLIINEAFVEGNSDYSIAWEFRYLHYDTFGRRLFKEFSVYERLLTDAGFEIQRVTPMNDDAFYSVVEATPIKETSMAHNPASHDAGNIR